MTASEARRYVTEYHMFIYTDLTVTTEEKIKEAAKKGHRDITIQVPENLPKEYRLEFEQEMINNGFFFAYDLDGEAVIGW